MQSWARISFYLEKAIGKIHVPFRPPAKASTWLLVCQCHVERLSKVFTRVSGSSTTVGKQFAGEEREQYDEGL